MTDLSADRSISLKMIIWEKIEINAHSAKPSGLKFDWVLGRNPETHNPEYPQPGRSQPGKTQPGRDTT